MKNKIQLTDTFSELTTTNINIKRSLFQMKYKTKTVVKQLQYQYLSKQRAPNENACILHSTQTMFFIALFLHNKSFPQMNLKITKPKRIIWNISEKRLH